MLNTIMLEIILYLLSVSYVTHVLLLDNEIGPFESKTRKVAYLEEGAYRNVNAFDWVRRAFGAMDVSGDIWQESDSALFRCPYCLSFWINIIFLPMLFVATKDTYSFHTYIFLIFAAPMVAGKLNE